MAEQLCRTYHGTWPTDALGERHPPTRRILRNHAILREAEEQQRQAHEDAYAANNGGKTPSGQVKPGGAGAAIRARRRKQGM